jgi:hypothetical protein
VKLIGKFAVGHSRPYCNIKAADGNKTGGQIWWNTLRDRIVENSGTGHYRTLALRMTDGLSQPHGQGAETKNAQKVAKTAWKTAKNGACDSGRSNVFSHLQNANPVFPRPSRTFNFNVFSDLNHFAGRKNLKTCGDLCGPAPWSPAPSL